MPMALPLLAAAGTVSAGIAAGGILGGVMIAGGAMTAIGAITGNKKLQALGGILGLVGGVAGLASGAWEGAASNIAGNSAQEAANAAWSAGGQAEVAAMQAASPVGDALGQAASSIGGQGLTDIGINVPSGAPGGIAPPAGPSITPGASGPSTVPGVQTGGTGMLDKMKEGLSWAKKNPELTQAGSGLLQGGLNYLAQTDAVKEKLKLQEQADQRARDRLNASLVGVKVPTYQTPMKG